MRHLLRISVITRTCHEFKEYLKGKISEQKVKTRRDRIISDIVKNLVDNSKFEVPEPMIKNRISFYNEDLEKKLKDYKVSREDYLKAYNINEAQFNENLRKSAVQEVKEYLIFNALEKAEAKNIEPTESQVLEEKEKITASYEKEEDRKKIEEFFDRAEGIQEIKNGLSRRNLIDLLIKNAKIIEEKESKPEKTASCKKVMGPGSGKR